MDAMKIDLLAFAGHKGLYGPCGTGGLVVRPGVALPFSPGFFNTADETTPQPRR